MSRIAPYIAGFESRVDSFRSRLRKRFGTDSPYQIACYYGHGNNSHVSIQGRVLENKPVPPSELNDSLWENLLNMYRRFETDEVPGARVRVQFDNVTTEAVTNEEGFFNAELSVNGAPSSSPGHLWHQGFVELVSPDFGVPVTSSFSIQVPPATAQFGVISDLDDTVLQTNATQLLRMARTVFLGNARTRIPFPGVTAFYKALQNGPSGTLNNPIFYVSSSPWNLYDLLIDFFAVQDIPAGPVFLRDWGISSSELFPADHRGHKLDAINKLLDTYRELPFILIGDSGQSDPEIYREVVDLHPGRIQAVYIRNVGPDSGRATAVATLAEQVAKAGSTLILAADTVACARHAVLQGWIKSSEFPDVVIEKIVDESEKKDSELAP